MIRLSDATILAYTKLRVHKVRTGVAVGVSGLLFGLLAAVIIVVTGVFTSVDNFADEGLNNRTILNISRSSTDLGFNEYDKRADPAFVTEIEAAHKAYVTNKTVLAKKYTIEYNPEIEDPSPIGIDNTTKQKVIKDDALQTSLIQKIVTQKRNAAYKEFDVEKFVSGYSSAKVIQQFSQLTPQNGQLLFMKDGKEIRDANTMQYMYNEQTPNLTILEASLSKPFITNTTFNARSGEIPVIIPFGNAEKQLGLKPLKNEATMQEKHDRLREVRDRISEVSATYCYRNNASQGLLATALAQQEEIKLNASDKNYVKPALLYTVPDDTECGAVTVASDTRTAGQVRQDAQKVLFEKELGAYVGEPYQKRITVRGVGISSEIGNSGMTVSLTGMIQSLFGSSLSYGSWVIPEDLLAQVPASERPDEIFNQNSNSMNSRFFMAESYLVEVPEKEQARKLINTTNAFAGGSGEVFVMPFGSGILFVDELKDMFLKVLLWMFGIVGGIAIIILASIIGRTVSEGRRESSIFRAIGASRADIAAIYGMYVLLLALRVVIFTAVLAVAIALTVELLYWKDATLGASLAYAASDTTKEFHLFSLVSPYLLWIIGVIFLASILASIIPIMLGARRNPIKDMRNDT